MRAIPTEEIKKICTDILEHFDNLCTAHNLKYSLAYGTLIGAVRHNGFIPWDDDIDVIMPREDYEKLLSLQYDDGNYEIKSCRYSKDYYYIFAKMIDKRTVLFEEHIANKNMGVYIDIFPYDRISPSSDDFDDLVQKSMRYREFLCHIISSGMRKEGESLPHHIVKRAVQLALSPLRKIIVNQIDRKLFSIHGDYYLNLVDNDCNESNLIPSDSWDNLMDITFEGLTVKALRDYDSMLTSRYGDYMQLPPENERISHHSFSAYYKD